jgi:hypothetical protein
MSVCPHVLCETTLWIVVEFGGGSVLKFVDWIKYGPYQLRIVFFTWSSSVTAYSLFCGEGKLSDKVIESCYLVIAQRVQTASVLWVG